jgi:hypothetical protein
MPRPRRETIAAILVLVIATAAGWLLRDTLPQRPVTHRLPPAGGTTLLVKMTGLLVIVPPDDSTGQTHVVLASTSKIPDHKARLRFTGDSTSLCAEYIGKNCYVDLTKWSLQTLGVDGTLPSSTLAELPPELANLTASSGDERRVNIPAMQLQGRILATLATGRAVRRACSLAVWYFNPVGPANATIKPVANAVEWEIHSPAEHIEVVFQRKTRPFDLYPVQLRSTADTARITLLHVPQKESDWRPRITRPAEHFSALYEPLHTSGKASERRLPRFAWKTPTGSCADDEVRRAFTALHAPPFTLDTFSCLPAAAKATGS